MAKSLKDHLSRQLSKEDKTYLEKFGDKFTDSTKYAQWIASPNEHEDHHGQSLVTRNHDVIMHWAEERGAKPGTIEGTEHDEYLGVLRFIFDENKNDKLKVVSWEEWFKTFDERDLVFVYQENLKSGDQSNFFRLNSPHRQDA